MTPRSRPVFYLLAALLAVVPVGAIALYSHHLADEKIQELVLDNNLTVATLAAQCVAGNLKKTFNLTKACAAEPTMAQALRAHDEETARAGLERLMQVDPLLDRVFVLDANGLLWSDFPHRPDMIGRSYAQHDLFIGVSRHWEPYVSAVYQRAAAPQALVVALAVPVFSDGDAVVGVMVLQYRLATITGWCQSAVAGAGGYAVVLDQQGSVAGHPNLDFTTTNHRQYSTLAPVRQALEGKVQAGQYVDPIQQRTMVAAFVPVEVARGSRWIIIAQQDRDEALARLAGLHWQIGLAAALVIGLATLAALALARSTSESQQRSQRLQQLAVELTTAEQRERKRLAALLHDHLQQLLVAAGMRLDLARGGIADEAAQEDVHEARKLIGDALQASRDLTCQLRPPVLYEAGLAPALRWLATEFSQRHGMEVIVEAESNLPPLGDDSKAMLYECARELFFNVAKYAQTKQARLRLWNSGDGLHLQVEDHGQGFDAAAPPPRSNRGGFGLFSIRERLAALGGRMTISSSPGQGATVELVVPLPAADYAQNAPPALPVMQVVTADSTAEPGAGI